MFSEIYNEIRKFSRGPIINHHNSPVPPLIKEFISRLYGIELGTDTFIVNSDDRSRYYISYSLNEKDSCISRSTITYMMGMETSLITIPRIIENDDFDILNVFIEDIFTILEYVLSSVNMHVTYKKFEDNKMIAHPVMFCTLLKNILKENMVSNETLYKAYNLRAEHFIQHAKENKTEYSTVCRFVSKDFFEKFMGFLDNYIESNDHQETFFSDFIFKYLDSSFIIFEDEIIKAFNEPVSKKEWGD